MTSDEFFENNEIYFDCIFIDALHIYEQVRKDILNSVKFLNTHGIIIIHDCLPKKIWNQIGNELQEDLISLQIKEREKST